MDLFRQSFKGPARPAPTVPGFTVNRYSPVTNWNDDPFGADLFEPTPQFAQKKKPPPRPPPPKVNAKQLDAPIKPSHFIRRPTVLTSLLSRKSKNTVHEQSTNSNSQNLIPIFSNEVEASRIFPKCEPKCNVQTGALIDLMSPPSSPTFTTRSSSDGLSMDSFGSDATTSTNHPNTFGGSTSQAESGFEDDFDLFLNSRKHISKEDTLDDFGNDPFSPQPLVNKPPLLKKPVLSKDLFDFSSGNTQQVPKLKGPTIIRAKPARPKPPDSTAILKSTFGNSLAVTTMNVNTSVPIQKVNGFGDNFSELDLWAGNLKNVSPPNLPSSISPTFATPKTKPLTTSEGGGRGAKPLSWESENDSIPEREYSPPMPSIPPPPPPLLVDDDVSEDEIDAFGEQAPYAIALFDYHTDHPDDLCFSANAKIEIIRRVDEEWLYGRLKNGVEGLFPSNYVDIKVPLPDEVAISRIGEATALYDFAPDQPADLPFSTGDIITVLQKLNDNWYYGECKGVKGQFPVNYVQMS